MSMMRMNHTSHIDDLIQTVCSKRLFAACAVCENNEHLGFRD